MIIVEVLVERIANALNRSFSYAYDLDDEIKYEWSRIPHFYRPYYVFTYSTGLITAITIAIVWALTFVNEHIKQANKINKICTQNLVLSVFSSYGVDISTIANKGLSE